MKLLPTITTTTTATQGETGRAVVVRLYTNKLYHKPPPQLLKNVPPLLGHPLPAVILTNRDGWIFLLDRERWVVVGRVLEGVCWSG